MAPIVTTLPTTVDVPGVRALAVCEGMLFPLTECCAASATGSGSGVACRACYRPVPGYLGWAVMVQADGAEAALAWFLGLGGRDADLARLLARLVIGDLEAGQ